MNSALKRCPVFYYTIHNQSFNFGGLSTNTYRVISNYFFSLFDKEILLF